MGVDTHINLSPKARFQDVAIVAAILLGCKPKLEPLGGTSSFSCRVKGLETKPTVSETMAEILITPEYGEIRHLFYHFEFGDDGCKGMAPRATAVNIALGVRLVEFFGGWVDFNDNDESERDFKSDGLSFCNAEDGAEWDALQNAQYELRPITVSEVMQYEKYASYKVDGSRG